MQTLIVTMDGIQPHPITLKSRVVLESPKDVMSSVYLCGASRLDTSNIIHEVLIRDGSGEMQRVRDIINCGTMSISVALRLRGWLGLVYEPAFVTTLGLNGPVMAPANECPKRAFTVQYIAHLSPLEETEVVFVPMWAYDLGLWLPKFQSRNPDVDWQRGWLLALRIPGAAEVVSVNSVHRQECHGNVPGSMARKELCSNGGGGFPDIQILRATGFDDLLASEQVVGTFFPRGGDCTGLLGATVEGITDSELDRPQALDGRARSSTSSRGRTLNQQCRPWMTATGTPGHEGSTGQWGLALPWANHL